MKTRSRASKDVPVDLTAQDPGVDPGPTEKTSVPRSKSRGSSARRDESNLPQSEVFDEDLGDAALGDRVFALEATMGRLEKTMTGMRDDLGSTLKSFLAAEVKDMRAAIREELRVELQEGSKEDQRSMKRDRDDRSLHNTYMALKWVWVDMRQVGEEFFDMLERPHKVPGFSEFIEKGEIERNLEEVAPLLARYRVIQTSEHTRASYKKILSSLKNKERPSEDTRSVLVELAALFSVTTEDGMCPVPLRALLALGKTTRERARGRTKESFAEVEISSVVSLEVAGRLEGYPWYALVKDLPKGVATGEDIKSAPHYKRLIRAGQTSAVGPGSLIGTLMPELQTRRTEASEVNLHRSASQVDSYLSSRAPRRPQLGARRPQLAGVTGPRWVSDRCVKCGRQGHRMHMCPQPHAQWKSDQPMWLLDEMSHNRVALPN